MTSLSFFTQTMKGTLFVLLLLSTNTIYAQTCDNVTSGGAISGDESGCNSPVFDPAIITSIAPSTGGSGNLEYIWMKTTSNPSSPFNTWQIIPGATGETYDPSPISQTTYYGRCSRRTGCTEYLGETEYVVKEISCCSHNATISPINATVCTGEALALSVTATGDGLTYLWEASGGNFDNPSSPNPNYTMMMVGTYSIKVTVSKEGCNEMVTTNVTVENQLAVSISAGQVYIDINQELQLNSTPIGNNYTYLWTTVIGGFSNNTLPNPTYSASIPSSTQIILTVADQDGCSGVDTFDIAIGNCTLGVSGIAQNATCTGANDGSIDLTVTNFTGSLTFQWDNGIGNIEDPANLVAGTYNVTVTDDEGCFDNASIVIGTSNSFSLGANVKTPTCVGDSDGQILIIPSGGTAPYTYAWNHGLPDSSFVGNLSPDTYIVIVSDGNGCTKTDTIIVGNPIPLTLTPSITNPTCGLNSGIASITVNGGTPDYSYAWNDPASQQTQTATNLAPGTYVVMVTDVNGCSKSDSILIDSEENSLSTSTVITNASCNNNDGAIDLTITGGNPPYIINWDNGIGNTEDPTNLVAGAYNVIVSDSTGCSITSIAIVGEEGSLNIRVTPSNVSCAGGNNGALTASASGGVLPYTYQWSDSLGSNPSLTNLSEGEYSVTVTDSLGCITIGTATIIAPAQLILTIIPTNANCNSATGSAIVEVSGGTSGYTYQWNDSNNQITQSAINLTPGDYTVLVTDANNCATTATTTILADQQINFSITPRTSAVCGGEPVQLTGSINDSTYNYKWTATGGSFNDTTSANPIYTMMMPGTYTIIAIIDNGSNCSKSDTSIITILEKVSLSATTTTTSCSGTGSGSIDLTITGGGANPTINWDNGIGSVEDPNGLIPGIYTVTVTNQNGCVAVLTDTIRTDTGLIVTLVPTATLCNGGNTGAITANVANGTPAYFYEWNNFLGNFPTFTALAQGIYTVTVTDANGCMGTATAKIHGPDTLKVNPVLGDASCLVDDGRARLDVTGGTPEYAYAWGAPISQNTQIITGLAPGSYDYTVTDANNCAISASVTISKEPDCTDTCIVNGGIISTTDTTIVCTGDGNPDIINVALTGNVGSNSSWIITDEASNILELPLTNIFSLDGSGTGVCLIWNVSYENPISGLIVGQNINNLLGCNDLSNSIRVVRERCTMDSCMINGGITIINPTNGTPICAGTPVNLSGTPNDTSFTYSWTASAGSFDNASSATPIYTMMMTGTYQIILVVSDGNCTASDTTTVIIGEKVTATILPINTQCAGDSTGAVNLVINTGTAPFTFNWDSGIGNVKDPTGLAAGTYNVTISDANNCSVTGSAIIGESSNLSVSLTPSNADCNGSNTGSITATATGGIAPISYTWSNGATNTNTIDNLAAGTFSVTVTDSLGCSKIATETIREVSTITARIINSSIGDTICSGTPANLSATPNDTSFTYSWTASGGSFNDASSPTPVYTMMMAGIHQIILVVSDGACSASDTTTVIIGEKITYTIVPINTQCAGDTTGAINLTINTGTAPYTINWDNGIGNIEDPTGLAAGTYKVTITDANNCTATDSVIISESSNLSVSLTPSNADCNGSNTGSITATTTGGILPISYTWSNGVTNTNIITNLGAGTFSVTVSDSLGCSKIATTTISEPTAIAARISNSSFGDTICSGESINLSASPIDSNLTYSWTASGGSFNDASSLTPIYTMMMAGTHQIILVVSDGICSTSDTTTVIIGEKITYTIVPINVQCAGDSTGATNLTINTGTAPYTINWDNGIGNIEDPTGLVAGTYKVTITDANNCTVTDSVIIGESSNLSVSLTPSDADCNGSNTGSITATTTGGILPVSYIWSNGATNTTTINNLTAGTFSVTVTDTLGCSKIATTTISEPTAIAARISNSSFGDTLCAGTLVNLSASPIDTNLTYSWTASGGSFDDASSSTPIYRMMMAGTHQIILVVSDGICSASDTTTIIIGERINYILFSTDIACGEDSTGTIAITINSGITPITYTWDNGIGNTANPTGLGAGIYTLTMTDANGCEAIISDTITKTADLSFIFLGTDILCAGENNGTISATVSGGISPLSLVWSNGETDAVIDSLSAGSYFLTVTDANGCSKTDSASVFEIAALTTTIGSIDVGCNETGYAYVNASGGTAPYIYIWNDSVNQTTDTAFNLVAGTYSVTVSDANSCTSQKTVTILETGGIICSIEVLENITTFNGAEGKLRAIASGGSGNYTYRWNNGGMDSIISALSTNTFIVTITDDTNCECSDTIKLENPAKIGDFVFEDVDSNGVQGVGELGIPGVRIQLTGTNYYGGAIVKDTLSDANGMYMFIVPPGTYKITVLDALGLAITIPDQGGDDELDSDIDTITFMSQMVSIAAGDTISHLDIGIVPSNFCDNILNGGRIQSSESICGPNADPTIITNLGYPYGGSGVLEYLWLSSHKQSYYPGDPDWIPIANSNSPNYDPGIITDTTYYIRCARRRGCDNYPGESNIVRKSVISCVAAPAPSAENLRTTIIDGNVELTWDGKIPSINGNFIIERSSDGLNFSVVNTMASKLSDDMEEYHFMDDTPYFGENYYRIQTFHPTMEKQFSNIAMAMIKGEKYQKVMIYPNPVQNEATIHFLEDIKETAVLQVVNSFGQILKVIKIEMPTKKYQLDLSDLPSGMYYLKFDNKQLKRMDQKIYKVEE